MQSVCLLGVTCNPFVYWGLHAIRLFTVWGLHAISLFTGGYMQSVCVLGVSCNLFVYWGLHAMRAPVIQHLVLMPAVV